MYIVKQIHITDKKSWEYQYMQNQSVFAWRLYNAALFRIRQIFTGYDKTDRTDNEKEVFLEVAQLKEKKFLPVKKVIHYGQLERLMRITNNPDFFAGLPMQTVQAVLKQAVLDFENWLAALRRYKKDSSGFLGKPRMPHYKKAPVTYTITNQDAVLYGNLLKLPKIKSRITIGDIPEDGVLKEVKVCPNYGGFLLSLTFECPDLHTVKREHIAAIDLGVDNVAAIVTTDGSSRLYKGGAILSENRWFAKERAKAVGIMTKGHQHMYANSRHLERLSFHHATFVKDQMHKISRSIVDFCKEHGVGTIVIGENKLWKQQVPMCDKNNQKFVQMPHAMLKKMITYKAERLGIFVCMQEESYTSKASFLDNDFLPVYGKTDAKASFSGSRIKRGLYRSASGYIFNADLNGAANIMRKSIPSAWEGRECLRDLRFLSTPEVIGFHELNPLEAKKRA